MDDKEFLRRKIYYGIGLIIFCGALYFITCHFQIFPDVPIEPGYVDNAVPYISWTILIYVSYYIILLVGIVACDDENTLRLAIRNYLIIIFISNTIFIFFPTKIPWNNSGYDDFFTKYLYTLIASFDTAYNACPSLHVSLSFASCAIFLWQKKFAKAIPLFVWGMLIALSTLTVKQHLFIDVIGGWIVCLVATTIVICVWGRKPKVEA